MSKKKHQHFLPEFYLKNFCYENKIYFYNFINKKIKHQTPETIAYKKYLYSTIDKDGKLNHDIEDEFGKIEDKTAPVILNIINNIKNKDFIINDNDKLILADFIASQTKRVPKIINKLQEMAVDRVDGFVGKIEKHFPKTKLKEKERYKEMFLKNTPINAMCKIGHLSENRNFVKVFLSKNWYFYYIDDIFATSFITTDDPVVRFCKGYENGGLGNSNTQIYFPLSSKIFLAMAQDGQRICRLKINNKQEVRKFNKHIASKATEIIIARDKKHLERIIKDQGMEVVQ